MFNLREFIINNLIKGVQNTSFSKEYASILATNYFLKGIISEEDLERFDLETTEEVTNNETVEENIEKAETLEEVTEVTE